MRLYTVVKSMGTRSASGTSRRPSLGDVLELGHGPILLLRVVDLVETGRTRRWPALVKAAWLLPHLAR